MSQTLQLLPGKYNLYIPPPVAGVDYTGVPTPSVSYQWKKNGSAIAGQTNPLLTGVWVEQAGGTVDLVDGDVISIDVILTNPVQVTTKTIAATIDTAQPAPVIDPITIRQLVANQYQTVASLANTDIGEQVVVASNVGGSVTITPPTLATYQWRRGFAPIAGATSQAYTLQAADADSIIDCVVTATNSGGTTSRTASVIVGTLPASGFTELTPAADSRLIYVATDGDDTAAAAAKGRGYYLKSDPEIGDDPTNPAGPIVAYQSPVEACKRFRGRNYNGTDLGGGLWGFTYAPLLNRPAYPDWLLFRRGQTFTMPEVSVEGNMRLHSPADLCGNWSQVHNDFRSTPGNSAGRSIEEKGVITAWGPESDPRPIVDPFGPDAGSPNMTLTSIETTGTLTWRSIGSQGSNDLERADNLLLEDIKAVGFAGTNIVNMSNTKIRRCVVSGFWGTEGNPNAFFVNNSIATTDLHTMVIEECVWDRGGYKDDPQQPRSWRGKFASALTTSIKLYWPDPDVYQYDNQDIQLVDVATNTVQISGTVEPASAEPIADSRSEIEWRDVSLALPSPPVASNPHKLKVLIGRYYSSGQVFSAYYIDVQGVFAVTGLKRIRIFNSVTSAWDEYEIAIGTAEQPLRSYRDRNLYLSKYDSMTLRGNIISRGGGGSSAQMREGGVAERNLFIWNEMALTSSHSQTDTLRHKGSLFKDNVVLHDDHLLPPGGWGSGLEAGGADDDVAVLDSNIIAHFHRNNNGVASLSMAGKPYYNSGKQYASKLMRGIVKDNAVYREFDGVGNAGGPGIMVMDNVHDNGVLAAEVVNNAISAPRELSMQGNASKPPDFTYSNNRFHSTLPNGRFRWNWQDNANGSYRTPPVTQGTFAQWQAAGYDTDATLTSDFAAFKAAAGWTAPERDIVSYMELVDPAYVVNEDVYIDEDSTGAKQTVRRRVWEVMADPSVALNAVMTEAQAKLTARRYHAFITFIQRAKENRKGAWDERWTAEAVNNYIREGFGKPTITGPYDERPLATRLMDYSI